MYGGDVYVNDNVVSRYSYATRAIARARGTPRTTYVRCTRGDSAMHVCDVARTTRRTRTRAHTHEIRERRKCGRARTHGYRASRSPFSAVRPLDGAARARCRSPRSLFNRTANSERSVTWRQERGGGYGERLRLWRRVVTRGQRSRWSGVRVWRAVVVVGGNSACIWRVRRGREVEYRVWCNMYGVYTLTYTHTH